MSKAVKILLAILIVVATFLATCTGFFYAKSNSLEKKLSDGQKTTTEAAASVSGTAETTTLAATTDTTTTATPVADTISNVTTTSADSRPSSPADTVTVGEGETLFEIGQKAGVSYTLIAEANGIDANKIKVGQTLMVPKNNQISFIVNKEKAASLQKDVDGGKYGFRLSVVDTAKADSPTAYGLLSTDSFVKDKVDVAVGSATVIATKGDKKYLITLVQPATKGEKGIWAIESIKPQIK